MVELGSTKFVAFRWPLEGSNRVQYPVYQMKAEKQGYNFLVMAK